MAWRGGFRRNLFAKRTPYQYASWYFTGTIQAPTHVLPEVRT